MKDTTFLALVQSQRVAQKAAEPYQEDTSRKWTKVPTGVWEKLMASITAVLHEEIGGDYIDSGK